MTHLRELNSLLNVWSTIDARTISLATDTISISLSSSLRSADLCSVIGRALAYDDEIPNEDALQDVVCDIDLLFPHGCSLVLDVTVSGIITDDFLEAIKIITECVCRLKAANYSIVPQIVVDEQALAVMDKLIFQH